jgi:hypothetical protein
MTELSPVRLTIQAASQDQSRTFEDGSQEQRMHQGGGAQEDFERYYRVLGVKEGSPLESVRRGYHRMSKEHQ